MSEININHIAQKKDSPLKRGEQSPSYLKLLGQNIAYSALQSPLDGTTQIIDKLAGTNLESKVQFINQPQEQKFNTTKWYVSQAGNAIGMLLPLMLSDSIAKSLTFAKEGSLTQAAARASIDFDTQSSLGLNLKQAALTGGIYGSVFTPADNKNFWQNKVKGTLESSFMFTSMTASSLALSSIAKSAPVQSTILEKALNNNTINSVVSSMPASALSTQVNSFINTGHLASFKQTLQQSYQMGIVSLGFGGFNDLTDHLNNKAISKFSLNNTHAATPDATLPVIQPLNETFTHAYLQDINNNSFEPSAKILIKGLLPDSELLNEDTSNSSLAQNMLNINDGKLIFTNRFKDPVHLVYQAHSDKPFSIVITPKQSIEISPNAQLRLGSKDGTPLEIFRTNETIIPEVYFQGKPLELSSSDNSVVVGRQNFNAGEPDILERLVDTKHGKIQYDPGYKNFIYTDLSKNGTFIKDRYGQWHELKYGENKIVSQSDEIHLASKNGPLVKVSTVHGFKLDNGLVVLKRQNNTILVNEDSMSKFEDSGKLGYFRNSAGQIVKTFSPNDYSIQYEYNDTGKLQKATINASQNYLRIFEATQDGKWLVKTTNPSGEILSEPQVYDGTIQVGKDGSLLFRTTQGFRGVYRPDGTRENLYDNGYQDTIGANLINQEKIFKTIMDQIHFEDPQQKQRLLSLENKAIESIKSRGVGDNKTGIFLYHINRLLRASNESHLNQTARIKLTEQILLNAYNPQTIDQGFNSTCGVTTIENRVYAREPQYAAKLIADSAITGKFITHRGKVIDMERAGALSPDNEAQRVLNNRFDPRIYSDIKIDGLRNFANQIFQVGMVNVHYSEKLPSAANKIDPKMQPIVYYIKSTPDDLSNPTDNGEKLILYYLDNNVLRQSLLKQAPDIPITDYTQLYNTLIPKIDPQGRLNFGDDDGFIIYNDRLGPTNNQSTVYTPSLTDFEDYIKKSKDKFPLILLVDPNRDENLFGPKREGHAKHVITIEGFREDKSTFPPKFKIEFANQWGIKNNRLGLNAIDSKMLYKASIPDSQITIIESKN